MAEEKKIKIDKLPRATTVYDSDIFPIVQGTAGSKITRATTVGLLNNEVVISGEYADLNTADKTIVGAINELKADAGASALVDLTDVEISDPTDGQVVKYDSASEKWINANDEGGGSADEITFDNSDTDLNATNVQDAIVEVEGKIPATYPALSITYNNSTSGLSSINVQGAIDELAATMDALKGLGLNYTYINIQSAEYTASELEAT